MCGKGVLCESPERPLHEAVEVKPMLQWILKDIGDARKVEHPLREALKTK